MHAECKVGHFCQETDQLGEGLVRGRAWYLLPGGFQRSDFILKFIAKTQPWTENHVTTMKFIEAYDCLEQSRAGGKNFAKKFTFEKIFEECHCASVLKFQENFFLS